MCGIAIARLGLTRNEFYDLSPIEFYHSLEEHRKAIDDNRRFELNKMRLQTFYLFNIQVDKKNRFKSPEKMMPFDWEKVQKEVVIPTPEKWDELQKRYGKGTK